MMRLVVVCAVCLVPALSLAGAHPFVQGAPPSPAPSLKKQGNVLKKDELPPCDALGRDAAGGNDCRVVEPVLVPRDGVTDELLEKYRLRK